MAGPPHTAQVSAGRRLRIALVAPPVEPVPPLGYGGTERVIDELLRELLRRGHEVTLFGPGDSQTEARLVATVPRALRGEGFIGDPSPWFTATMLEALRHEREFDVIHGHLDFHGPLLAITATTPVASTFHGRLDQPYGEMILSRPGTGADAHTATRLVAVSHGQAAQRPDLPWTVVHNGLSLDHMPFGTSRGDHLAFVGRIAPEKGVLDAIEVARLSGRLLKVAAKEPYTRTEVAYFEDVFRPAMSGANVELLGELGPADRDVLLASSHATLIPSMWPEPFGLAAIESLACGTPVIARRIGGLPEIVRHGVDGFLAMDAGTMASRVGDVAALDREAIRRSVLERFSAARMTDGYEGVYWALLEGPDRGSGGGTT